MNRADTATLGVVDVETTPIRPGKTPRTRFWGLAMDNGEPYRRFETTDRLIRFLRDRADDLRLYNHHDFDVCQLIVDGVWPENIVMRGSRIVKCEVAGSTWINSYALFPTSLAKILGACGFTKRPLACPAHETDVEELLKVGYDLYDTCAACRDAVAARNESDTVEALASFLKLGRLYEGACYVDPIRGGYCTAAGAAFAAAEQWSGKIPVDLTYRQAYRGGRTEAFHLLDCGEVDAWDIGSSYPFSFLDLPANDALHLFRVKVKTEDEPRPFFADGPREEGLVFPAGTFETWCLESSYERYIRPHGGITSVRSLERVPVDLGWVKKTAPLVESVYKLRSSFADKNSSEGMKFASKIFLNSVYGRLGMRPSRLAAWYADNMPEDSNAFALPDGSFLVFKETPALPRANYPMAAAITCNARARLYDGMRRVGGVAYCDTDSIYTANLGASLGAEGEKKLGGWAREERGQLHVRTVKDYEFAGKTKRKGGAKSTLWTVRLALGKKPVQGVEKTRRTEYSKRRVRGDGSTAPHVF